MDKVLIVIDAQNDFINGSLGSEEAQKAVPIIIEIVKYANKYFYMNTFLTKDTHFENYFETQEGKRLPISHCQYLTPGWSIQKDIAQVVEDAYLIEKSTFGYCNWKETEGHTGIALMEEIVLCGFCTDICVMANFQILKAAFPEIPITIISDACAGTTPEMHEAALNVMKSCQANVMTWDRWKSQKNKGS